MFRRLLIKRLIISSFFILLGIDIISILNTDINWAYIHVSFVCIFSVIFILVKKELIAIYIYLIGISVGVFLYGNSNLTEISVGIIIVMIIISGITTDFKFTLIISIIDFLFVIISYIFYLYNPEYSFIFTKSWYILIAFIVISFIISNIISKRLYGTINEQREQYI